MFVRDYLIPRRRPRRLTRKNRFSDEQKLHQVLELRSYLRNNRIQNTSFGMPSQGRAKNTVPTFKTTIYYFQLVLYAYCVWNDGVRYSNVSKVKVLHAHKDSGTLTNLVFVIYINFVWLSCLPNLSCGTWSLMHWQYTYAFQVFSSANQIVLVITKTFKRI